MKRDFHVEAYYELLGIDEAKTGTLESMQKRHEFDSKFQKKFIEQGFPFMTAVVMGNDHAQAAILSRAVELGMDAEQVVWLVGSYARFEWARKNLDPISFLRRLPELWVSSDPMSRPDEALAIWQDAYLMNGSTMIKDESKALPEGDTLTVYHGHIVGGEPNVCWTLDRTIAEKFAKTGGGRQEVEGGEVLKGTVKRKDILAYLTSRGESEVIVDPSKVSLA